VDILRKNVMPKGPGTYGSNVGRPSASLHERAAQIMKTLNSGEQNIVNYHKKNLGLGAKGPDGRPMTVYAIGPEILTGPNKGKFASVPGFVPGYNNNKPLTEDQARDYWQPQIDAGTWPIYETGKKLNARSKEIHTIMDADESASQDARTLRAFSSRNPYDVKPSSNPRPPMNNSVRTTSRRNPVKF
jgi:hypothetical protein